MSLLFSVVVPTCNKADELHPTLEALACQTIGPGAYEVIVVDNGSADHTRATVEAVAASAPHVRYLFEPERGRSRARNTGIAAARGEYVLLLDDDIRVRADHLERRLAAHRAHPHAVVIGYIVDESPIRPAFCARYFLARQTMGSAGVGRGTQELDFTQTRTGSLSVERSALESAALRLPDGRAAYLDEELPRREDTELGYRLHKCGQSFVFARDAVGIHHHTRDWHNIRTAADQAGYSLYFLERKVPGMEAREKHLIRRRLPNLLLLVGSALALPVGLLIEPLSPWLMMKATGGLLAAIANRGYQRAVREATE